MLQEKQSVVELDARIAELSCMLSLPPSADTGHDSAALNSDMELEVDNSLTVVSLDAVLSLEVVQ